MKAELDFVHEFVPGSSKRTLLLLHGTGGNEHDLIPLGREIDPAAAILSPRGKVLENGMPRFFRRLAEGVFDEDDLKKRTHELADFVGAAAKDYEFAADQVVAVGYSNGANIAASLLLLRPEILRAAILFRAMVPLATRKTAGPFALCAYGSARETRIQLFQHPRLSGSSTFFAAAGADVTIRFVNAGHGLTNNEIEIARDWLMNLK